MGQQLLFRSEYCGIEGKKAHSWKVLGNGHSSTFALFSNTQQSLCFRWQV